MMPVRWRRGEKNPEEMRHGRGLNCVALLKSAFQAVYGDPLMPHFLIHFI